MWSRDPRRRRIGLVAALSYATAAVAADNLACNGTGMDWYMDMVGETPCTTYQKLRGICNSQYAVGVQNVNTPPDSCSDQLSTCCCNNVAFALSMLCLNCQQNIGTSTGFDAGTGAYQLYLGGCSASTGLTKDIQSAVCNQKIKINDDLYSNGWGDGQWFYVFTRDTMIKNNIADNNNSFTHCASTTINTSSSLSGSKSSTSNPSGTSLPSTGDGESTSSKSVNGGAIAGAAVGGVVVIGALVAAWYFCFYRKRKPHRAGVLEEPLGAGGMRQRRDSTGVGILDHDSRLVPTSYPYSDRGTSDYGNGSSSGPRSDAGGSSSPYDSQSARNLGYGVGLGAASAAPQLYNPYGSDTSNSQGQYSGPLSPRRGFHTAGQASGGSSSDLHGAVMSAALGGARSDDSPRPQAGPLPRKRRDPPIRGASEEPFLEADEVAATAVAPSMLSSGSERHLDGGPVDVSLSRSPSGRLPPAYGEQMS
ncbi:hypothetical protein MKEN_00063600 [Mycena kentingensis (nom. inval.)]|nr:hypothetical protein MKEN_00063600 [Mycena kentingensis (nom. inval.)]